MAEASLLAEVPRVGRARGFRLYDTAGRRLVDLWQAGGGAILGHRPLRASNALKDALARGLAAPLVSPWEARLLKALAVRFPSYRAFRLHATLERALAAASRWLGRRVEPADLADPGLGTPGCGPVGLWRPFLPEGGDPRPRVLVPVCPRSKISAESAAPRSAPAPALSTIRAARPALPFPVAQVWLGDGLDLGDPLGLFHAIAAREQGT